MTIEIESFNARWLKAWSEKDVERLVGFYAPDTLYFDPQTPHGLNGRDALRAYLTRLFGATPAMRYDPHETWATPTGFCGRWYCVVGDDPAAAPSLRGFDLVEIVNGLISRNEVYVHALTPPPA